MTFHFEFQSTFPARGTTKLFCHSLCALNISIHVPREGNDWTCRPIGARIENFNPRSPRGERPSNYYIHNLQELFQSTFPARGTTCITAISIFYPKYFNPRSPRGERHLDGQLEFEGVKFQSTFPARGTTPEEDKRILKSKFQSTFPARGTTDEPPPALQQHGYFNPRSPRGERPKVLFADSVSASISIHVPREGNDLVSAEPTPPQDISIHVPREGNDTRMPATIGCFINFNPRSPRGERRIPLQFPAHL